MRSNQVCVRVDLGVIEMKLKPYYQMHFIVMTRTTGLFNPLMSNGNKGVFHILQSSRTGASPYDGLATLVEGVLPILKRSGRRILQPHMGTYRLQGVIKNCLG